MLSRLTRKRLFQPTQLSTRRSRHATQSSPRIAQDSDQSHCRLNARCNTKRNLMGDPSSVVVSGTDFRVMGPNVDVQSFPDALKKECILFYTPDTEPLARKIAQASSKVTLAEVRWGCVNRLNDVENEGEVATAFTLSRILSNIPLPRGGPTSIVIFDIHALQERFYFGDNVLPLFESGIPLLIDRLRQLPDLDNITIAYPDEGAWKRFHYQFKKEGWPEVICTKVRDGAKRIVRLKEGEPKGRHVVIVDDLVQSGGTLIECHALLSTLGAKHVSAYVTHGVFPMDAGTNNYSWQKFKADVGDGAAGGFRYFWLTDSHPITSNAVKDRAPFEVLSLASPIAAALQI